MTNTKPLADMRLWNNVAAKSRVRGGCSNCLGTDVGGYAYRPPNTLAVPGTNLLPSDKH